jgi:uncharacterized membrane protein YqiK
MPDGTERKRQLLAAELLRYFGETCPALAARWQTAIVDLAPPILRELTGRLQEFEVITDETNRQLKAAQAAAFEDQESAEVVLDRALASLEHLNEVAEAITRHLDELPRT